MEPTAQTNSQTFDSTFSAQTNPEGMLPSDVVNANNQVLALHKRSRYFQLLWAVLIVVLLILLGLAAWLFLRGRNATGVTGVADQFSPTKINLASTGSNVGNLNLGQVTVNGNLLVTGDANINGTLSAGFLQGDGSGITNLNPFNISGIIGPSQLDPFIAYTNKNFQAFTGTNQVFRNSSNSSSAFVVQNASSSPVLSVDTSQNFVGVNSSVPSLPNGFLSFETNGNAKIDQQLLVGTQSTPNATILSAGNLLSNRTLQRTLTVQQEVSDTSVNRRIYTGSANELLVNPSIDALANDNIFAGSYSSLQTAPGNSSNYPLLAGQFTSLSHAGSGLAVIGISQFNTVGLQSVNSQPAGNMLFGIGNASVPSVTDGTLSFYSGYTAIDPTSPLLSVLPGHVIPPFVQAPGVIQVQMGLEVMNQHNGLANVNIQSEGVGSRNIFEGLVAIGACSPYAPVNNLVTTDPINVPCNTGALGSVYPGSVTGGNKLLVNLNPAGPYIDSSASVQLTAAVAGDKPLVVVASPGQTADLTQWQNSTGTVLSSVSANGRFNIGAGAPTNRLSVVDTSDDTPANFTGSSGTCTVDTLGGGWSCVSDERLKTNIMSIDGGLDKIMQLRGVTYNWKSDPNQNSVSGFIAQDVEKVLPGLVSTLSDGTKTLNKDGILPYLVNAIQQQQAQIDQLKVAPAATSTNTDTLKTLADAKAVEFGGDLTIDGNVIVKGVLVGNADTRGSVTVPAGSTEASYGFTHPYASRPNVVISPVTSFAPQYRVVTSTTGFTIYLQQAASEPVEFNFQAQQ